MTEGRPEKALNEFVRSLHYLEETLETRGPRSSEENYALAKMLGLARALYPTVMYEDVANDRGDDFETDPPIFGGLVPIKKVAAPALLEPLLRKSTLYAKHTSFVTPHRIHLNGLLNGSDASVSELLALNRSMLPLLAAGRCSVLPAQIELNIDESHIKLRSTTTAPMVQEAKAANFAPLNQGVLGLTQSTSDRVLLLREFVLPYYPEVDSNKLAELASEETDAFEGFMSWFTGRVRDVAANPEAEDLNEVLDEIDEGVAKLRIEAANLARSSYLLRGATISGFSITLGSVVGAAFGLPASTAAVVAGITGASTLTEVIRDAAARRKEQAPLRSNTFFLPYLNEWKRPS